MGCIDSQTVFSVCDFKKKLLDKSEDPLKSPAFYETQQDLKKVIFPSQESNNTLAKYTFLPSGLLCSPALPNKVQQGFSFVGCCEQKANSLAFFLEPCIAL